ncbi:MAG TPA: SOS response-associated peptidase [Aggregatilineales bacterium]|nr:SOS response-associated peptidase [Anaerolineales bacterium]HRE47398.1 SOS response-associated peptidase [Aggregatilineales bacterium]
MCGRYAISVSPDQLALHFNATLADDVFSARLNAAPSESLPVMLNTGERRIERLQWGLIPAWAKDATVAHKLINARAETVEEKPSFRDAFKKRRCLVLADSFYEWETRPDGKKYPMRIALESGKPFAFAGLWETWQAPAAEGGDLRRTFTILTIAANDLIAPIHQRMPVILSPEGETLWLDNAAPPEQRRGVLLPFDPAQMVITPVDDDRLKKKGA